MNNFLGFFFIFKMMFIFAWYKIIYFFNKDYEYFIYHLTKNLSKINILYIKVFQAIAFNHKVIDENLNKELIKFTDNAPWTDEDIDYTTLSELIRIENIILDEPKYSGMISLVYTFQRENQKFAIKIKRNNIDYKLNKAIKELLFLVKILSYFSFFKEYKLYDIVNKHIDFIQKQIYFEEEVENLIKMRENCKKLKYIKIPIVYPEITKKFSNVIMMEYLDGIKLNNISSEHYEDFAKQVVKFGFVTTYYHGFTHADLHAGNILFIKEDNYYKLGILDLGMMLTIDNDYKFKLFELLYDIFEEDVNIVAKNILCSNVIIQPVEVIENLPKEHYNYLIEFIVKLLNDTIHNKENTTQYRIYEFISKFHEYINKYSIFSFGLYLNDNFIKTQLILIMYHGIFMKLCKENWLEIFNKTINELFHMELLNELRTNKLMIVSKKEE